MAITAEQLMVEVKADVRQALREIQRVESQTGKSASRMSKMSKMVGGAFAGAAIVGGIKKTIGLAMDFDTTMRQVGIQTDQTGKRLDKLGKLALKMGADTAFSAADASEAMLELAKGGLSAADIKAGALQTTMKLAAAGGVDLASAAGYVTQGMNTFGLKAKQADQIVTALAGGANASTASVESLGMALSQVGPGAKNAGMNIQETVAALAAFDNAGIKGSDAGTSLKTMLTSLVPATDEAKGAMKKYGLEFVKRNGDFKSMAQVADELKDGLGKLSKAERVQALRTIFGSDATRAATVLMNEGRKGVQKYIRATKDRTKAQEMADAAMKGAKGAWEGFKGSVETAAIQLGTKLLPAFTKAADMGAEFISEAMTWGPQVQESLGWIGDAVKGLEGPFRSLVSVGKTVASFLGDLPGPVKEMAVQAGLAALVLPRLTAGLASVSATFTTAAASARTYATSLMSAETRSATLAKTSAKLMGAAKAAAGIGGMVALAQGAEKADTKMGLLATTAGGAMLGFSLGGPIGGAIGAGAGALMGLSQAAKASREAFRKSVQFHEDYAASLDQVTGAATRATKATMFSNLQKSETITVSRMLGIPDRDAVNAAMGDVKAMERIKARVKAASKGPDAFFNKQSAADFVNGIKYMGRTLNQEQKALLEQIEATKSWSKALKGVPKKVQTKLEQMGYQASKRDLETLIDRYDLTPKEVRTMVKALGTDVTKRELETLIDRTKDLGRQHPRPSVSLNDGASGTIARVTSGLNNLNGKIARTYVQTIYTATGKNTAQRGGESTFANGGYTGRGGKYDPAGIVHRDEFVMDKETTNRARPLLEALHATKGRLMGFAKGGAVSKRTQRLRDRQEGWEQSAKADVREMVRELKGGVKEIRRTFKGLNKSVSRVLDGRQEKKLTTRMAKAQRRMISLTERQVNIQGRLNNAQDRLAARRETKASFAGEVRAGISSQATVLNAGNSASAIQTSLGVQVGKVKKFARMLQTMRKMGYGDALVRQVASAGVEGGWQAAVALTSASKSQVKSISSSFASINKTANSTASQLSGQMYDSGIKAAAGLVAGLKARRKAVENTLRDIAVGMQKALKKALGIRSPSRVMMKLGDYTGRGLVKGLDGTRKDVAKASHGLATASIFPVQSKLTPANLNGGQRAGSSVTFQFITHNPQAEPQSRTVNRSLAKVATLGLV